MHLGKINIRRMCAMNSGNLSSIYKMKIQLSRKQRINSALRSPRINKSIDISDAGDGDSGWIRYRVVAGIKANVHPQGRA